MRPTQERKTKAKTLSYTDSSFVALFLNQRRFFLKMKTRTNATKNRIQKAAIRPFFHPASFTEERKQVFRRCQAVPASFLLLFT